MSTEKKIPFSIKKLFWDIEKDDLDIVLHKKNIIERIINYGILADWQWLSSTYSKEEIRWVLDPENKLNRTNIRPSALHLASILFR